MSDDIRKKAKELIKLGIKLGDRDLVDQGKALLNGQKQEKEEPEKDAFSDFKMQIRDGANATPQKKMINGEEVTIARKEPVGTPLVKNVFDPKEFKNKGREHSSADKKLYVNDPVPRRKKVNLIKVSCEHCRKKFEVNPIHVKKDAETRELRYTCDSCIKRRGT